MGKKHRAGGSDVRSQARSPGYCYCGKLAFNSKSDAKLYLKQRPFLQARNIYRCNNYGMRESAPFHMTSIKREDYEGRAGN